MKKVFIGFGGLLFLLGAINFIVACTYNFFHDGPVNNGIIVFFLCAIGGMVMGIGVDYLTSKKM